MNKEYFKIKKNNEMIYMNKLNYIDEVDNKIDKDYYTSLREEEQYRIILQYAIEILEKEQNKRSITLSDLTLMKKIFDFSNCSTELLTRAYEIFELFEKCEINLYAFLSYGVNTNAYRDTWGDTILNLLNLKEPLSTIAIVWEYYRNLYFKPKNKNMGIVSFLNFLETYLKYSHLLKNTIIRYPDNIPTEVRNTLDNVFSASNLLNDKDIQQALNASGESQSIETTEDYEIFQKEIDDYLLNQLQSDSPDKRDELMGLLFFLGQNDLQYLIDTYGDTKRLKLLQFNNRNNPHMVELIENILVISSFIETLASNINDKAVMNKLLEKIRNNRNYLYTIRKMLSKYQKMMITLYELESNCNLTNIDIASKFGTVKGKRIGRVVTTNSGMIRVLDLSQCKYALYAHVVSDKETMSRLVNGEAKENQVFISLSPISHRNQVYYRKPTDKIILAYDHIPEGSFILSSEINVGSNHIIQKNSADFMEQVTYHQNGILETSMAPKGNNAETVVLREGLKPSGIIIPGYKTPTDEEIKYSMLYNLPLIFTQPPEGKIMNPSEIELPDNIKELLSSSNKKNMQYIGELPDIQGLISSRKSNKIGVITDLHGMYEPTLAILEDMRRMGITEIYSLGDNIGFGPNPHEVLELLREYNVKSIYGNHEIYAIDGMDALGKHMATLSPTTVEKDKKRTEWTREQLTEQDIEDIMQYDSKIVIERGGKKITLIHSRKDDDIYEDKGHFVKPEVDDSSIVIEGHEHFESKDGNSLTLRAAGMGFNGLDYGQARYLIIDEDGSFQRMYTPYNIQNFKESINESSMGSKVRTTIDKFVRR